MVRASGLDWVLVQPVHLTDDPGDPMPVIVTGDHTLRAKVSRRSVGRFHARAVADATLAGKSVAVSGPGAGVVPAYS